VWPALSATCRGCRIACCNARPRAVAQQRLPDRERGDAARSACERAKRAQTSAPLAASAQPKYLLRMRPHYRRSRTENQATKKHGRMEPIARGGGGGRRRGARRAPSARRGGPRRRARPGHTLRTSRTRGRGRPCTT